MSYNGSGTFLINSAGQPVVANTVISATVFNALTSDLATGLSTAITKDGQTTITNNIPFSSNKITGLGSGTAAADAANLGQVQSTVAKLITVTGTDTITGSMSPQLTAYAAGQLFYFVANAANTGAVTINIDSLGAKSITRDGSSALAAGDINSGEVVVVIYDGTRFQMINAANSFGNTTINGTLTVTGNAGFQANVSITSALSVGGVFAVTGAATFTANPTLSAGTANGVAYLNGSKALTTGSAFVFDGTNVGIGTSSPGTKLDVSTNTSGFYAARIFNTNASGFGVKIKNGSDSNDALRISNAADTADTVLLYGSGNAYFAGSVGIGTSSPSYKLHVVGGAAIANRTTSDTPGNISLGVLSTSSVAQFGWRTDTSNNLNFDIYNGASWSAALTTSLAGNLGLGVTPSAWSTGKAAEIGGVGSSVWGLSSGTTYFTAGYYFNTADKFAITGNYALFSQLVPADGSFRWVSSTATGTAGNNATMTERMRLDASGNLGIGTSSPASRLQVDGANVTFDTNAIGQFLLRSTTAYNATPRAGIAFSVKYNSSGTQTAGGCSIQSYKENATDGDFGTGLLFTTQANGASPTERARITSGGYFKASNDGTYVGSTSNYHEFRSTNNSYAVYITNTNASPLGTVIEYTSASPNGTGNVFLYCGDSTALRAEIRSNGGIANYSANNVALSDARIKNSITPAASMWDKVAALEIVAYKYNDQTHDDVNLGVIAQQVEAVEPVWVDADGFGKTPEGEEPLKTVYTTDITFAAIKALQEAMARIEQLEAKVAVLENK